MSEKPRFFTDAEMMEMLHIKMGRLEYMASEPGCPVYDAGGKVPKRCWPADETMQWMKERAQRRIQRQPLTLVKASPRDKPMTTADYLAAADRLHKQSKSVRNR